MKIFRICPGTLGNHLRKFAIKNNLGSLNFNETIKIYQKENILLPGSWAYEMSNHGFEVFECIYNDINSQSKWAIENNVILSAIGNTPDLFFYILTKQIEIEKPDLVYIYAGACILVPIKYRKILKKYNPKINFIAYWGDELPKQFDYQKSFSDTIINFTSSSKYTEKFIESGLDAITLGNCFEPTIKVNELAKTNNFVFCGTTGYGFPDHVGRYEILKEIMKDPRLKVWGSEPSLLSWKIKSEILGFFIDLTKILPVDFVYNFFNSFKNSNLNNLSKYIWAAKVSGMSGKNILSTRNDVYKIFSNRSSLRTIYRNRVNKPLTNGSDYYGLVKSSNITLNIHRDEESDVGNIRCYEATGLGSCLLTDHGEGMKEFFDIDTEVVTFDSAEECIEKLDYLENNPMVLHEIRVNGQKRTLKDHTTKNRVDKIAQTIKDYYGGSHKRVNKKIKKIRLIANYDLDLHPISYDFIFFLQAVYIKSNELLADEVIVNLNWPVDTSEVEGIPKEAINFFAGKIDNRIKNILLDVSSLFPFISIINNTKNSILIKDNDSMYTHIYPSEKIHHNEYYRVVNKNPYKLYNFRPTIGAIKYVDEYINKFSHKKIITLTLRSYEYDTIRNNNIEEWVRFLSYLDQSYKIIIIPDTDNIYYKEQTDLKIYDSFVQASFSFDIRLAIYEKAHLNLFINNGPCVAASLNKNVNFLLFKVLTPSIPHCSKEFLADAGYVPFENPGYLGKFQRYVWSDDNFEVISQEFNKIIKDLNS